MPFSYHPSYIDKSGKHTPGVGYFWCGCARAVKYGLEIVDIAVIDADEKDALLKVSNLIAADAFFSKESFVSGVTMPGFHLVSRFGARHVAPRQRLAGVCGARHPGRLA